jgi:hypothetical protein
MVHALPPLGIALEVTWAVVAGGSSAIAGVRAVFLAAGMLPAARIVMLRGVTEVHHG